VRRFASAAAVALAAAIAAGGAAAGGGPGGVYNDFVHDGKLSCNHSHADLEAALRSGTLNQYGDPYELARLRLAIRRQLAGGCRRGAGALGSTSSARSGAGTQVAGGGQRATPKRGKHHRIPAKQPAATAGSQRTRVSSVGGSGGSFLATRGLILLGLVVALGLGGWLTRRALARD
jgi:hypothetical protein